MKISMSSITYNLLDKLYKFKFVKESFYFLSKLYVGIYKYFIVPKYYDKFSRKFSKLHICSIKETAEDLVNSNKSIGRFGDGEIGWVLNTKNGLNSFEKNSPLLNKRLIDVLTHHKSGFMIGLPDSLRTTKGFTTDASNFWKIFYLKHGTKFLRYLNNNVQYYNTSISRPYMDYDNRHIAKVDFTLLRKLWNNKHVLIVEGSESRLGIGDDLFNNVKDIKRIECPVTDAFESYNKIKKCTEAFLRDHKSYITLISLGPTATVLAYDLYNDGYRAIDIGHIDVEYAWYLIGAKDKINLPHKYVNEVSNGHSALPVNDRKYYDEIVAKVK